MLPESLTSTIDSLLRNFSLCSHELGGLEFYGYSMEFRDLLELCRGLATVIEPASQVPRKAYVFLDDFHGKSSLAKAMAIQAETNGGKAYRFDGTIGVTSKHLRDLQQKSDVLVIVDGLPEVGAVRAALLDRLNSLEGRAVLLAWPEYVNDANLRPGVPVLKIPHIDERQVDKVVWLFGLVREQLRDEGGIITELLAGALSRIPVNLLATLCGIRLGRRVAELEVLASKIAQTIRLSVALRAGDPLPEEELAAVFVEFYSSGTDQMDSRFRLWVEGESDLRMLKLVCRLALPVHGLDLGEGLAIVPLGLGRDGCSRVEPDVEIEDFVSVGCLDRFYVAHPDLRPEREVIRYKSPVSRRLVVDGAHKEQLMRWLEDNASLEELENLIFVLCDVRSRFSLRSLPAIEEKQKWKKRLVDETIPYKHIGVRPSHWVV